MQKFSLWKFGWHVATDEDWKALELSLGMPVSELDAYGWRAGVGVIV